MHWFLSCKNVSYLVPAALIIIIIITIIVHDCIERSVLVLDVSIPADFNIVEKEHEKVLKYQDLCLELQ